jgi:hypothetical protein
MKSNLSASPLYEEERIEVRSQFDSVYVLQSFNRHPALSLSQGEAIHMRDDGE